MLQVQCICKIGMLARILLAVIGIQPALFYGSSLVHAQTIASGVTLSASAGFGGNFRPYTWLPVRIHLENSGPAVQGGFVQARFTDISDIEAYTMPLDLPTGARKDVTLLVYSPSYGYQIEVAFFGSGSNGTNERKAVHLVNVNSRNPSDYIFGIIASTPSALNPLSLLKPVGGDTLVTNLNISEIPDESFALASLNMLIFADVDTSLLSQRQMDALSKWVFNGGRLVVCGGAGWQKTSAGLQSLLPFQPSGLQENHDWSALNELTTANLGESPNQVAQQLQGTALIATGKIVSIQSPFLASSNSSVLASSETLAASGSLPLAVRQRMGSGEVVFLTFDPQKPPFNNWSGIESVYRAWFGSQKEIPNWAMGFNDWYNATNAAQTLPNVTIPSVTLVCGFLFVYMLALGPVNFIILRRLKRRELAWITIPGMVVVFSLGVLLSGGLSRSQNPVLNRLAIVQAWPNDSNQARLDGIVGLYSPYRAIYQVNFGPGALPHPVPNRTAINGGPIEISESQTGYRLPNLMVDISGITPLAVEGSLPAPQITSDLALELDAAGAWIAGTVRNLSGFDLENSALIMPGSAVALNNFSNGETREIRVQITPTSSLSTSSLSPLALPVSPKAISPLMPSSAPTNQIDAILGTSNYYADRSTYQRYTLLMGIMQNTNKPNTGYNNTGYYLTGWTNQTVIQVDLQNRHTTDLDTTLYIIQLKPALKVGSGNLRVPPALFSWKALETNGSLPMAYQMYLYGGEEYSLEYKTIASLDIKKVTNLEFHLSSPNYTDGSNTPVQQIGVRLWDFTEGVWVEQTGLVWGSNMISDPARFVSLDGTIRLNIRNTPQNYALIGSSEFFLTVER